MTMICLIIKNLLFRLATTINNVVNYLGTLFYLDRHQIAPRRLHVDDRDGKSRKGYYKGTKKFYDQSKRKTFQTTQKYTEDNMTMEELQNLLIDTQAKMAKREQNTGLSVGIVPQSRPIKLESTETKLETSVSNGVLTMVCKKQPLYRSSITNYNQNTELSLNVIKVLNEYGLILTISLEGLTIEATVSHVKYQAGLNKLTERWNHFIWANQPRRNNVDTNSIIKDCDDMFLTANTSKQMFICKPNIIETYSESKETMDVIVFTIGYTDETIIKSGSIVAYNKNVFMVTSQTTDSDGMDYIIAVNLLSKITLHKIENVICSHT